MYKMPVDCHCRTGPSTEVSTTNCLVQGEEAVCMVYFCPVCYAARDTSNPPKKQTSALYNHGDC